MLDKYCLKGMLGESQIQEVLKGCPQDSLDTLEDLLSEVDDVDITFEIHNMNRSLMQTLC